MDGGSEDNCIGIEMDSVSSWFSTRGRSRAWWFDATYEPGAENGNFFFLGDGLLDYVVMLGV